MILISSKLGLLLVVFTIVSGEQGKDSAQLKPASEKARLRDWFFRLSLRNDLMKLKEDGQDYLPVVKLRTDDGEGEDFSILVAQDYPHANNNCSSQSANQDKEMRFVMRGLDQEFMCTQIKKKIQDVPEERSMSQTDTERRGPKVNFIEGEDKVEEGEAHISVEQFDKAFDESNEDIDQIIAALQNTSVDREGEDSVKEQDTAPIITNNNNNNLVETITSSSTLEFETAAVEKESISRKEFKGPEVYAKVIDDKNDAKTFGGLAPLIDHLEGVASHQQFEDPFYAKTIQDLVKDFRKHNLSEASWDQDKLNTILDKIEEIVTGDKVDDFETLPQILPQVNPENPESPEARMADSENEGRVNAEKQNSAGSDGKDDRATAMEKVINDLRKFVDVASSTETPHMRSADSNEDNRSKTITDGNATSSESVTSGNASTTEQSVQIETTEDPVQIEVTEESVQIETIEEPVQIGDGTTLLSSLNLTTEESATKDDATDDTHNIEAVTTEEIVDDGESTTKSLNDTDTFEDYSPEGLIDMLSSWKKKFFIILGCFIVSMVLFLIIIAVLIYKVQQNKPNPHAAK